MVYEFILFIIFLMMYNLCKESDISWRKILRQWNAQKYFVRKLQLLIRIVLSFNRLGFDFCDKFQSQLAWFIRRLHGWYFFAIHFGVRSIQTAIEKLYPDHESRHVIGQRATILQMIGRTFSLISFFIEWVYYALKSLYQHWMIQSFN